MLPLIVDEPARRLDELIAAESQTRRWVRSVAEVLDRAHDGAHRPANGLTGAAAADYLHHLIEAVSRELISNSHGYSSARWLWYLRRLPRSVFEGLYSTTFAYDSALAESLSWSSTRVESSATTKVFGFRVDGSAARHLLEFVLCVRLLSHLHAIYRRIGKGAWLVFENGAPFAEQDESVAEAIRIYDRRHEGRQFDQAALGVVGAPAEVTVPDCIEDSRIYLFAPCQDLQVPVPVPLPRGGVIPAMVSARHMFHAARIDSFLKPYSSHPDLALRYLNRIEPLIMLQMMFPNLCTDLPALLSGALQFGYGVVTHGLFKKVCSSWLTPLREHLASVAPNVEWSRDFEEWFGGLKAISPQLWPLKRAGCIRETREAIILDLVGASAALLGLAEVERSDSEIGNIRAETFEVQIQEMIDETKWKPNPEVAALRGRPLRRNGRDITDIDAIGVFDGQLLPVSCKSLIYDAEYDRGTFRVISNASATVDKAVTDWVRLIDGLNAAPRGDNFDFTLFTGNIVGVVCTPFVVYSSNHITLTFVRPRLRRCVAPFEIRDWLRAAPL